MDGEDHVLQVKDLPRQRNTWQHRWWLRYTIGPFLTGLVFDLWQVILGYVDAFLWQWAEKGGTLPLVEQEPKPQDARGKMRQALETKSRKR